MLYTIWIFLPCRCTDVTYGGYRNGFRGHSSAHRKNEKEKQQQNTPLYLCGLTGVYNIH